MKGRKEKMNTFSKMNGTDVGRYSVGIGSKTFFTREQVNMRAVAVSRGAVFMDDSCTVKLAESSVNGMNLSLCMRCLKNDGNQLVYVLFEKLGETEYGVERMDQRISDKHIREQKNRIDTIIGKFTGKYDDRLASIKIIISIIHEHRLLNGLRCVDIDRLPANQIIDYLKEWIFFHANDSRIEIMELKGREYVVFICPKDYKKGIKISGIFKEIFQEIAPHNNFGMFKGELVRRKLVICDANEQCIDIQKTISRTKCRELGTDCQKVICFNFDQSFVQVIKNERMDADELIGISEEEIEEMFMEGDFCMELYNGGEEDVYSLLGSEK